MIAEKKKVLYVKHSNRISMQKFMWHAISGRSRLVISEVLWPESINEGPQSGPSAVFLFKNNRKGCTLAKLTFHLYLSLKQACDVLYDGKA